jgi:hypothetical protein
VSEESCEHVLDGSASFYAKYTSIESGAVKLVCQPCLIALIEAAGDDPHEAIGYNVYRSIDPSLPKDRWERMNEMTLPDTRFRDSSPKVPGATYYYYVVSVNAYGVESKPSKVIQAVPLPHNTSDQVN